MIQKGTQSSIAYREVTREIQVEVEPVYLAEESSPEEERFVFAYHIRVTNLSEQSVQLVSRHWVITDGRGKVHEVIGEGVVGEKPKIEPGESYEYSSFCPLTTPTGNMRGNYQFAGDSGELFKVKIPLFFLRDTRNLH